jgi:hypothetical protein
MFSDIHRLAWIIHGEAEKDAEKQAFHEAASFIQMIRRSALNFRHGGTWGHLVGFIDTYVIDF